MCKIVASTILIIFALLSFSSKAKANCSKDLDQLILKANWPAKPSDSDFYAALSGVRLRAHLIFKEELDNSKEQTWWQPNGHYFKGVYQAKKSKQLMTALFDRSDGLWAYQVKSKSSVTESVCIDPHRVQRSLSDLGVKTK